MKTKDWPEDGRVAQFSDLVDAVRDALRQCYTIQRINKSKDATWKGPKLPECMKATCLTFDEGMKADSLRYQKEDQGHSAIDVIIGIAIQLGIEQGRRMYKQETMNYIKRMLPATAIIHSALFDLKDLK